MSDSVNVVNRVRGYNPLTLAFIGDAVYELLVRRRLVEGGELQIRKFHDAAVEKVRASYQAAAVRKLEPMLTDEEADIIRRGRNANVTVPKSATVSDYRYATGLEALFGYLSLIGANQRIEELFEVIYEI